MKTNSGTEWIWYGSEEAPFHYHLYLRKPFEVSEDLSSAQLHITASDRYRLFVNGKHVGRGPARCDQRFQTYDTHDIVGLLKPGKNVIAVDAYFYGCSTGYTSAVGRAGFLAQLELTEGSTDRSIGTDSQWRAYLPEGWDRSAKPVNISLGVIEVYDARKDPPDWMTAGFDDSEWAAAQVIPRRKGIWSRFLQPRDIPLLKEEIIWPDKVLKTGEILCFDHPNKGLDIPQKIASDIYLELELSKIENCDALLRDDKSVTIVASSPHAIEDDVLEGVRDPYIVIDFGRQVNARPTIDIEGPDGGIVDMTYSEMLLGGRVYPSFSFTNQGDRCFLREGRQTWQTFEYKSFRYLQITFRQFRKPARIHFVSAERVYYPTQIRGKFSSNDAVLNKVFQACLNTIDLCTDDGLMDSPHREKRNWLGDGSHALLGLYAAWGDVDMVRRYFNLTKGGLAIGGLTRMFFPGTSIGSEKTKVVTNIPQHALVWAMRTREYYDHFGGRDFLGEMYPVLSSIAGWFEGHCNDEGLIEDLPYWNWLDWAYTDMRGISFGTNAFFLRLLEDLAFIAKQLAKKEEQAIWQTKATRTKSNLRIRFWSEERGCFLDSFYKGRLTGIASELANGLALLFDIADEKRAKTIAANFRNENMEWAQVTPLFHHYVLQGLFRRGYGDIAFDIIRDRFGPMMKKADTIWEAWHPFVRAPSIDETKNKIPDYFPDGKLPEHLRYWDPFAFVYTHCAGTTVAFVMLTDIIGIKPTDTAFAKCELKPNLGLLQEASGTFPAKQGDISLSWKCEKGHVIIETELPEGVEGSLIIERSMLSFEPERAVVNEEEITLSSDFELPGYISGETNKLVFSLTDGKHEVRLHSR